MTSSKNNTKFLSKETILKRFHDTHGDKYDYSLFEYNGADRKSKIICKKHGIFEITPTKHYGRKQGCIYCGGKYSKDDLEHKLASIHNNKYKYDFSEFKTVSEKTVVKCPDHGNFNICIAAHLRGSGCKKCFNKNRLISKDKIIKSFISKHGNRYIYDFFEFGKSAEKSTIVCPDHGEFMMSHNKHSQGSGCPECAGNFTKPLEEKIKIMELTHGHYDYSLITTNFGSKDKLKITCKDHGVFEQTFSKHSSGQGCPKCAISGWSKSKYIEICKNNGGISSLYVLKMFDSDEIFYKVGITKHDIDFRMSRRNGVYNYELIEIIQSDASYIWDLEKKIHKLLYAFKYTPIKIFSGHTECFSKIPNSVLRLVKRLPDSNQLQLIT